MPAGSKPGGSKPLRNDPGIDGAASHQTRHYNVSGPNTALPERSEEYPGVVAVLDARTRVIAGDIQWIMQHRAPSGNWRDTYFFHTREGLLYYAPKPPPAALLALPDLFPEPPASRAPAGCLGMREAKTASHGAPEIEGPLYVKEDEAGSFAVLSARTGAPVEVEIDSKDKAEGWREGYEKRGTMRRKRKGRRYALAQEEKRYA